ncbi:MAG: glycosyltransferase family 2 protein [Chloroflexi bacterium]|nr:glycosyltransferase family 2 protein [Chloroflexota bacterium]
MESRLPPSSLIICSRNRPRLLFETVESVLRGSQLPAEMVIVDQSAEPNPDLPEMKTERPCEVRYLHSKTVGVSAGRNLGITSSRYDVLIFIDDDMFVASDWYDNLMRAVVHAGRSSVVTGRVLPGESEMPDQKTSPSTKADQEPAVYQGRIGRDVLYSGNMGAYRSVLKRWAFSTNGLGRGRRFPPLRITTSAFACSSGDTASATRRKRSCSTAPGVPKARSFRSNGDMAWGRGLFMQST